MAGHIRGSMRGAAQPSAVPAPIKIGPRVSHPQLMKNRSTSPPRPGLARMSSSASLTPTSPCARPSVQSGSSFARNQVQSHQPIQRLQSGCSLHSNNSVTQPSQVGPCSLPFGLPRKSSGQSSQPTQSNFHQPTKNMATATVSSQSDSDCLSPLSSATTSVGQPLRWSMDSSTTVSSQSSGNCSPQRSSSSQFSNWPQSQQSMSRALSTPSLPASTSFPTLLSSLHGEMIKCTSKAGSKMPEIAAKANDIFDIINRKRSSSISKLDLIRAVEQDSAARQFLLPDIEKHESDYESIFEEASSMFTKIAHGKKRVDKNDFLRFFQEMAQMDAEVSNFDTLDSGPYYTQGHSDRVRHSFALIDVDGDGVFSKLDLLCAVQREAIVASLVFPLMAHERVTRSSFVFDAVDDVFEKIALGKKRVDITDFVKYVSAEKNVAAKVPALVRPRCDVHRHACRALLIAPGFGQQLNPRQCRLVEQSGFKVEWINLPNPETPGFAFGQHLGTLKSAIDRFQPNLVAGASKGGHYITALWNTGLWRGPTLLLNAHPGLRELPKNVSVVVAHGLNDDLYPRTRTDLEHLISTGTPNMCFLYTTGDSGKVGGVCTRQGDGHNMETLLHQDCLPRLMDATLSLVPEMYMMWTWREKLAHQRIQAEQWLGYSPEALRRFWVSTHHRGLDSQKTYDVPYGCEEFQKVAAIFRTFPREEAFYRGVTDATWQHTGVVRIERIENGLQEGGSAQPYYESLQKSVEEQGISFEPGLHTRWAFHGTSAIDSIVDNPMAGFQPLLSGTRLGSVWGYGTYFARDAKYVVDSNLCTVAPDGSRKLLMCLLMTGMSCLGAPEHNGVLPFRQKPHRYNSSVDSLSSPEIFVMQHPSSAHPAYIVTFR